jgi:hypothetical protein
VRSHECRLRVKSHKGDINPVHTGAGKRTDVELGGG